MANPQAKKEGKIKFYNEQKGYGFITNSDTEEEIFFHRSKVQGELTRKDQDKVVTYNESTGKKGPEAADVRLK